MRLVADESVEALILLALRSEGHEVLSIGEAHPGIDDAAVLSIARQSAALLVTADKDFGELVFRNGERHFGVLLLRFAGRASALEGASVLQVLSQFGTELMGAFSVLTSEALRIRQTSRP